MYVLSSRSAFIKGAEMRCPSCSRDVPENASHCSYCDQKVHDGELNQPEMAEIRKELKGKRYERTISYAASAFFLLSGVVGATKINSSFPVWMVVASFVVSALLLISGARCGKRIKELNRRPRTR